MAFRGLASPDSPLTDQPGDPPATAIEHGSHLADSASSLFHRGLSWGRLYTLPLEPLHLAGGNPLVTGPGLKALILLLRISLVTPGWSNPGELPHLRHCRLVFDDQTRFRWTTFFHRRPICHGHTPLQILGGRASRPFPLPRPVFWLVAADCENMTKCWHMSQGPRAFQ